MKLSIIIPIYNAEQTLKRCIESILSQSFTDYELILIDDGSNDKSAFICDEFKQIDGKIKVKHQKNKGLSAARNAGLEMAQGEYITFVDSDDSINENTLQDLMEELTQHPNADILEYPILERIGHSTKERLLTFTPREYNDAAAYWLRERAYHHTYACNKIYKRQLFAAIHFPEGKIFEDALTLPYLIGLTDMGNKAGNIIIRMTDKGRYLYDWNPQGITNNARPEDLRQLCEGHMKVLENIVESLKKDDSLMSTYQSELQDFMTQILNISLDIYELSGQYEPQPLLIKYVRRLHNKKLITTFKLKMLYLLGYHTLCKINKLIHKIYRHH